MTVCFDLQPSQTALLIVDVQEKLLPCMDRHTEVLNILCKLVKSFQILKLPIFISEQYPQGLGHTTLKLKHLLNDDYQPKIKTHFSCLDDPLLWSWMSSLPYLQWVIVGLEAHICVLQTAKGLLRLKKQIAIPCDAIASRFSECYKLGIEEMRTMGLRMTCVETILFELLKDAKHPSFKLISNLIKTNTIS